MTRFSLHFYLKQLNVLLLWLLFAFPILPLKAAVILMIVFGCSSVINFFVVERAKPKLDFVFLIAVLFPLLYLINFLLYPDSHEAWFEFEKRIALLVVPVIFSIRNNDVNKTRIFTAFHLSVFLLSAGTMIYLLWSGINENHLIGGLSYAIRVSIEELTRIHPTYFSLFAGFSFYLVLYQLLKSDKKPVKIILQIVHLIVLLMMLVLLSSKIFFLSSFVIIPVIIFKSKLKVLYQLGLTGFFGVLMTLSVIFVPGLNQRLSELSFSKIEIPGKNEVNSTNMRFGIYHCAIELIKKNIFWGVGTSKLQQELNHCYQSINIPQLYEKSHNTHNEYLNIWLGIGFTGLLVFLSLLFFSFRHARGHDEHLIFLILFCTFCLTENLLSRQHGVFIFIMFNYYFLFSKINPAKLPD